VSLGVETAVVDQEVGIGDDTGHRHLNMVVQFVKLSTLAGGHEQGRELFFLGGQNNTCENKTKC